MSFLDDARNGFGQPLTPDCRARLVAFFENPCHETWDEAFSIIIINAGSLRKSSVWAAVTAIDPTFPTEVSCKGGARRWKRVPDALLVARAIKAATNR